jgi:hypothetical protein
MFIASHLYDRDDASYVARGDYVSASSYHKSKRALHQTNYWISNFLARGSRLLLFHVVYG